MIRLVFDSGEIQDCEHIVKIYIDPKDSMEVDVVKDFNFNFTPNDELVIDNEGDY